MTAVRFEGCCPHALGDEAFQIRLNGLVFRGYDVPTWLGSPSGSFNLLIEEIRGGRRLCCPDEFLLMLWQITRKRRNTVWFQPNTSICHFYMREDICEKGAAPIGIGFLLQKCFEQQTQQHKKAESRTNWK